MGWGGQPELTACLFFFFPPPLKVLLISETSRDASIKYRNSVTGPTAVRRK